MDNNRVVLFFEKIWPTIKRVFAEIFYFIFKLVKTIIKIGVGQIKGN